MKSFLSGDASLNGPLTQGGVILLKEIVPWELGYTKKHDSLLCIPWLCPGSPWRFCSDPWKPQDGLSPPAEWDQPFQ